MICWTSGLSLLGRPATRTRYAHSAGQVGTLEKIREIRLDWGQYCEKFEKCAVGSPIAGLAFHQSFGSISLSKWTFRIFALPL
jgi:hypothetical protein